MLRRHLNPKIKKALEIWAECCMALYMAHLIVEVFTG